MLPPWTKILTLLVYLSLTNLVSTEDSLNKEHLQEIIDVDIDDYSSFYDYDYDVPAKIPFCCDRHHYYNVIKRDCIPSNHRLDPTFFSMSGEDIDVKPVHFENITGFINCTFYIIQSNEFSLLRNGDLLLSTDFSSEPTHIDEYCLIWTSENASDLHHMSALVCFPETNQSDDIYRTITHRYLIPILMGISACFLAVTFVVYLLVKELQDLLGKAVMCSVLALCFSKICGVITILISNKFFPSVMCIVFGIAMHTGFLISFFWLNVISFIVFFSTCCQSYLMSSRKHWFLFGCIYAFGIPAIILTLLLIHDFTSALNNNVVPKPGFGKFNCGFSNREANIVYFYAPLLIIVSINVVLFSFSACRLYFLTKQSSAYTFQFKHYLKLFLLMGIPWIFECLSYFFGETSRLTAASIIWLLFDIFNGLQGVVIFFVFIWRRSVLARMAEIIFGSEYAKKKFPEMDHQLTYYEGTDHYQLNHTLDDKKTPETVTTIEAPP